MKLFRSFRQNFIEEGQLRKYVLYAIGEIFLVMIGITLAFQLDNWNDNRIKGNLEVNFYKSIWSQIADDKELIQSQMDFNNQYMTQFKYAQDIIENNDRNKLDTLGSIIRNFSNYSDFDKQGNIYETMVNSGQITLLQNQGIVNGIRELEELYIYINRMENIHYDAIMNHVVVAITPVIKYATGEVKKPDAVFSYEFQNLVYIILQVMEEKNRTYSQALVEIDRVSNAIIEELEK